MTLYFPVIKVRISVAARGFLVLGGIDYFGASPYLSFSLFLLSLPLEIGLLQVGPLNLARGSGECCQLPNGVWSEALAANDFGAFCGHRNATVDI